MRGQRGRCERFLAVLNADVVVGTESDMSQIQDTLAGNAESG